MERRVAGKLVSLYSHITPSHKETLDDEVIK